MAGIIDGLIDSGKALYNSIFEDGVIGGDSALWDMATGAAVGAGVAWATDNDIALGAGIGLGAGFLTSSGSIGESLTSKFDLTDMVFGSSSQASLGIPGAPQLQPGVEGPLQATQGQATGGLLNSKIGLSLVAGGAQAFSQQQQLDRLLEDKEKDRQKSTIRSTGNFSGLPSSVKRTGTFMG